ncbi:hypothetical protein [Spiroplasma endosymbiont of Nebria brevicollis]|uniref:hypothetical protein n=1 Tax=Spiroplasma endosymbiont of Nebria brevicollis TaxID=3066284 RepID=UPI00313BC20F
MEALADKIAIIKSGKIISEILMKDVKIPYEKIYLIKFSQLSWKTEVTNNTIKVFVKKEKINDFLKDLTKFKVDSYTEQQFKLEEHFLKFYGGEINDQF